MILSFYKFIKTKDLHIIRSEIYKKCLNYNIKGTVILASEGVNANLEGTENNLIQLKKYITEKNFFKNIDFKFLPSSSPAFKKLKVKIKKEIVTFKVDNLDVENNVGTYLTAEKWDQLINDNKTMIIDTRNHYEYAIGTFKNAINPKIHNFSELKEWLDENLKTTQKNKPIAMFCTGGIRCEKSTTYLKEKGFRNVYHLKGGIISYIDKNRNNWQGKCFLFDDRISI